MRSKYQAPKRNKPAGAGNVPSHPNQSLPSLVAISFSGVAPILTTPGAAGTDVIGRLISVISSIEVAGASSA